jgi:hypothetical protein
VSRADSGLISLAVLLLASPRMATRLVRRDRPSTRSEIIIGRSLAICAHPYAAWRTTLRSVRLVLCAGYFTAGYLAVIALMTLFG